MHKLSFSGVSLFKSPLLKGSMEFRVCVGTLKHILCVHIQMRRIYKLSSSSSIAHAVRDENKTLEESGLHQVLPKPTY